MSFGGRNDGWGGGTLGAFLPRPARSALALHAGWRVVEMGIGGETAEERQAAAMFVDESRPLVTPLAAIARD